MLFIWKSASGSGEKLAQSVEPIHSPLVEGPAGKFFVQYGGNGMSIGRQYYLAKKRPEETPQDYLYRLNEAEHRAKVRIRDGSPDIRREHVEHLLVP